MKNLTVRYAFVLAILATIFIISCGKDDLEEVGPKNNTADPDITITTIDSLSVDEEGEVEEDEEEEGEEEESDGEQDEEAEEEEYSDSNEVGSPVTVIDMTLETQTSNSLVLRTILSEGYPLQLYWGLSEFTINQPITPVEMSSTYGPAPGHKTTISGLPSDTDIYIETYDPTDEERLVRRVFVFKTAGASVVIPPIPGDPLDIISWPSSADGNLPYAGLFLGNAYANQIAGNTTSGSEIAVRFRAQRTGYIDILKVPDRSITQNDLDTRPGAYATVRATGANLEEASWMLPNSYVVGKPILTPEIRTVGSDMDNPEAGSIIGGGTVPLIPTNSGTPEIPLSTPLAVNEGQMYWIIWRNSQPVLPGTKINGNTLAQAQEPARRTMGAMSFNGSQQTVTVPSSEVAYGGPWRSNHNKVAVKKYSNSQWSVLGEPIYSSRNVIADMSVHYTDGVWTGKAYSGWSTDKENGLGGTRILATNHVARQKVRNPANSNFISNGIWVYFGYKDNGGSPDQSPIHVTARNVNTGAVLATGTVPYDDNLKQVVFDGLAGSVSRPTAATRAKMWKWVPWSSLVTIPAGGDVYVELSATSASKTSVVALNPLDYGKYQYESINVHNPERAQFSKNNGNSWENWSTQYSAKQLLILLTKDGELRNF